MTRLEILTLLALDGKCAYSFENKAEFRRLSMKLLRRLRALVGMDGEIRFNAGGPAVSGDAILHADKYYVTLNANGYGSRFGIMYRTSASKTDYVGGQNHYYSRTQLAGLRDGLDGIEGLAAAIKELVAR